MNKKKAYVIGTNVSQSLSPLIFNYWLEKSGNKGEYTFKEIKPKNFDQEIDQILKEENVCGFNVTIPYKKNIIKHLDSKNLHAEKIGAVNCVTIGKKIKGINNKIYVVIGDGEINEGTCWESFLLASHHNLDNLNQKILNNNITTIIIDHFLFSVLIFFIFSLLFSTSLFFSCL